MSNILCTGAIYVSLFGNYCHDLKRGGSEIRSPVGCHARRNSPPHSLVNRLPEGATYARDGLTENRHLVAFVPRGNVRLSGIMVRGIPH